MSTALKDRPARTYVTGTVTRTLRYVAVIVVAVLTLYVAFTYDSLPETVPTHFGLSGEADAWGPRSTVWWLVGVNALMVGAIAGLSTRPRWFNYVADITDENAQRLYREGERMMVWLNVALLVVFAGIVLSLYETESPFVVLGLMALPAVTITGLIRMSMAADKKPQSVGGT